MSMIVKTPGSQMDSPAAAEEGGDEVGGGLAERSTEFVVLMQDALSATGVSFFNLREIECLLNDNHQKGKMKIMIMKTSGSQVDSPVAEGKRKEGGGRKIRDLHRDT